MSRAIFLDRDGVINNSIVQEGVPYAPIHLEDFKILPGVLEALLIIKKLNFKIIVVTNQPDIKTGKQKIETLNEMHNIILANLPIDKIMMCCHIDSDECSCRKPRIGMLTESAKFFDINLQESWMVGDRWRDILAGQSAGCQCFFIDFNYSERKPNMPYIKGSSLLDFANMLSTIESDQQGNIEYPNLS